MTETHDLAYFRLKEEIEDFLYAEADLLDQHRFGDTAGPGARHVVRDFTAAERPHSRCGSPDRHHRSDCVHRGGPELTKPQRGDDHERKQRVVERGRSRCDRRREDPPECADEHPEQSEPFDDPEPVVRGSDIVTTCTDSNKLVVTDPAWIEKGMHLANCSSKEFSLEIVKRCDVVAQVGTETFGAKGGMAESERHHGWASWVVGRPEQQARIPKRPVSNLDFVNYPSLIDLLNNPSMRRTSPAQITFFHNLGLLGFQFAAVAAKAYQIARAKGVGLEMSTAPFLQDIRD